MAFSLNGCIMGISVFLLAMLVGGVSEMQLISIHNPMATLTTAHIGKIVIDYEI